jgi:hypothetical protein
MNTLKLGLISVIGVLAFAFAGSAYAAVSPKLTVSAGGPTVSIKTADRNPSDDAIAKLEIYVPSGFGLKAPVGGTSLGTVSGQALVKDIDPGTEHGFTGDVIAISPTDPTVAYENASCDNSTHAAAWLVRTRTDEATVNFPIFVDRTSASESQFGSYKLVICMRSPDLAGGSANRAAMGTKIDSMRLVLKGFTIPKAAGEYRWRSLWTPYATGTESMNAAARVEAQSLVRVPTGVLTLKAKRLAGGHFQLSGRLIVGGEPADGVDVAVSHGVAKTHLARIGSTVTNGSGTFRLPVTVKKSQWFLAGATLLDQDLGPGACQASFGAGVPCVDTTVGASHALSTFLRINP